MGVVLGIIGLRRTADGVKKGRWAAVLAVVGGVLATLALVGGVFGVHYLRDHLRALDRAEAGMCADLDESEDGIGFIARSCSEPHTLEVVAAGDFGDREEALQLNSPPAKFCARLAAEHYRQAASSGDYLVTLVVGSPLPTDPEPGDSYACYFTRADGADLTEPILAPPDRTGDNA